MTVLTAWSAASSRGLVRQVNQDSAYAGPWLYAVADGMGGHVAGEVASGTVIAALADCDAETSPDKLASTLAGGVRRANDAIRQRGEEQPQLRTMGTTLTAMLWSGRAYALAHIGDSRAYRLRGSQLRQLTEDHSLQNLVAGARTSQVLAPIMSRFLDGRPDRSPDVTHGLAVPGDRYLLCSDGLSGVLPEGVIRSTLARGGGLEAIVANLTTQAIDAGGPDNITVIAIDVLINPVPAEPAQVLGAAEPGRYLYELHQSAREPDRTGP